MTTRSWSMPCGWQARGAAAAMMAMVGEILDLDFCGWRPNRSAEASLANSLAQMVGAPSSDCLSLSRGFGTSRAKGPDWCTSRSPRGPWRLAVGVHQVPSTSARGGPRGNLAGRSCVWWVGWVWHSNGCAVELTRRLVGACLPSSQARIFNRPLQWQIARPVSDVRPGSPRPTRYQASSRLLRWRGGGVVGWIAVRWTQ